MAPGRNRFRGLKKQQKGISYPPLMHVATIWNALMIDVLAFPELIDGNKVLPGVLLPLDEGVEEAIEGDG